METIPKPTETAAADEPLAYSVQEAAELLGVHYFTVCRLIQRKKTQSALVAMRQAARTTHRSTSPAKVRVKENLCSKEIHNQPVPPFK
jgi:transposase